MSSASRTTPGKLPFVAWVLAAGTFLMGTSEFVIAGLLPELAGDFGVGVSDAGLLIIAFALGMISGEHAYVLRSNPCAALVPLPPDPDMLLRRSVP